MTFIEPLDLETIFINTLAGSVNIFIFLLLIVIAVFAAKFKMNNTAMLFFIAAFAVIIAPLFAPGIYAFVVILGGTVLLYLITRFIKQ